METTILNYNDYVISTEQGEQKGIFLRNPIQRVNYDAYSYEPRFSAWRYKNDLKNPFFKLYQYLIGNKKVIKIIDQWETDEDWCGFFANKICMPVYFSREYRKLHAISQDANKNIQEVISYGWEPLYNDCLGACEKEITKFIFKSGSCKVERTKHYYYTFVHVIKDIFESNKSLSV